MNIAMAPMDQNREARSVALRRRQNWSPKSTLKRRAFGDGNGRGRGGRGGSGDGGGDGKRASGDGGGNGFNGGGGGGGGGNGQGGGGGGNGGGRGGGRASGAGNISNNNSDGGRPGNGDGNGNGGGGGKDRSPDFGPKPDTGSKTQDNPSGPKDNVPPASSEAVPPPDPTTPPSPPPSPLPSPPSESTSIVMNTINTTSVVVVTSTTGVSAATSTSSPSEAGSSTTPPSPILTPFVPPPDTSSQPRKGVDDPIQPDVTPQPALEPTLDSTASSFTPTRTRTRIRANDSPRPTGPVPETALGLGISPTTSALALPAPTQASTVNGGGNAISATAQNLLIAAGTIGGFIMIVAGIYVLTRAKNLSFMSILPSGWRRRGSPSRKSHYRGNSSTSRSLPDGKPALPQRQISNASTDKGASFVSSISPMSVVFPPLHVVNPETRDSVFPDTVRRPSLGPSHSSQPDVRPASILYGVKSANEHPYHPELADYNNTYNTNATFLSNVTSNAYDPAQRENNHLSYLSSLSSGFGDQIIIPDPGRKSQAPRQSRKFSWASAAPNRDTVYTTTSIETAPRFRTVNSWVAQQTGRVERQLRNDREIPAMPTIPLPLKTSTIMDHRRQISEDPAFRQHPGEPIDFSRR